MKMALTPTGSALVLLLALAACRHSTQSPVDGDAALRYVAAQLAFGPRAPGTPGHEKCGDWLEQQFRIRADSVSTQTWVHVTADGKKLPMRNILARFRPSLAQRVLFVTHWDTRPTSDQDTNVAARSLPIAGANDGASGPALFLALADAFRKAQPTVGVDLLLVDGEDYGNFDTYSDTASNPDVLIGSTYFARHLPSPGYRPLYGVLWDMIGDRDLQIYQEGNSLAAAPEVVRLVWQTTADLGYAKTFIPESKYSLIDDHTPLNEMELRVIDVIDYDYCAHGVGCDPLGPDNFHHTQRDTFDKVSARSLAIAGRVALALVTR